MASKSMAELKEGQSPSTTEPESSPSTSGGIVKTESGKDKHFRLTLKKKEGTTNKAQEMNTLLEAARKESGFWKQKFLKERKNKSEQTTELRRQLRAAKALNKELRKSARVDRKFAQDIEDIIDGSDISYFDPS